MSDSTGKDIPLADKLFSNNIDQQVSCFANVDIGRLLINIYDVEKAGHTVFSICNDGNKFIAFVRKTDK